MLDDMLDYLEHIRERPVWQPIPQPVRDLFHETLPAQPTDLATVHASFMHDVLPYAVGNAHPGFMGWVHGGGTPVGMLAEMLAAGLNANLGGRDQMPIEVERQILQWMRELFGFPDSASGLFVTGTSMANLIGVLVARTAALGTEVRQSGVAASGKHLTAYASAGAHGCIAQAMDLAGLGMDALRIIPVNEQYQMDNAALEQAIAADRSAGFTPFFIAATAGSVDVGAIDDLAVLADIAQRQALWFHVDGAYGALAMLAPDIAPRLRGIERADSIAFDFHKWGQVPYDAGFILVRDGALHHATFASPAAYLRREACGLAGGSPWPCDFGPDLSRGFRALKTWFTIKVYGAEQIGQAISGTCALAQYMKQRIEAMPMLELMAPVALNIVCFRYRSDNADQVNTQLAASLQESGIAAPSTTTINGHVAIRAAIVNHRTETRDIDALLQATLAFGEAATSGRVTQENRMNPESPQPSPTHDADREPLIGLAALMRMVFSGADLGPLGARLLQRAETHPHDANTLLDLSTLLQLQGNRDAALAVQAQALEMQALYHLPAANGAAAMRLLVIMGPGDLMANSPMEFLVEGSDIALDMLYVAPHLPLPALLPEHDVAFVAVGESDQNRALLHHVADLVQDWPRPLLNAPERIAGVSRDGACALLASAPGVVMPATVRIDRQTLEQVGREQRPITDILEDGDFPIIVRPVDSHAGQGLDKFDSPAAITGYLQAQPANAFYVSRFVDYRGADGLFRKCRIVLIGGHPYVCHMAISEHWMIHYLNAGMTESAEKRAEEARFMAGFDDDFARRHAAAFRAISARMGLDYLGIDCGETAAGELLIFEVDSNMIVHALDPVDLFPYKQPQMRKVFTAFRDMLTHASHRP